MKHNVLLIDDAPNVLSSIKTSASPAIIDERIFFEAQKLLEEARELERTRLAKSEKRVFLLSGLLTCGETGLPLVGQAGRSKDGTVHRYYHYVRKPKGIEKPRRRLSADELEEKLLNDLRGSLRNAGYFDNLAKTLKAQVKAKNKGSEAERIRAAEELTDLQRQIDNIWSNQARMQLNEDALRSASDKLNGLAKRKKDLENYMRQLESDTSSLETNQSNVLFVEGQIRALLQGWDKGTPQARKRLLRRTIKEIVVTRTEMNVTFWLCAEERIEANLKEGSPDTDKNGNILSFRRRSPSLKDRNLSVVYSGKVLSGSGERT